MEVGASNHDSNWAPQLSWTAKLIRNKDIRCSWRVFSGQQAICVQHSLSNLNFLTEFYVFVSQVSWAVCLSTAYSVIVVVIHCRLFSIVVQKLRLTVSTRTLRGYRWNRRTALFCNCTNSHQLFWLPIKEANKIIHARPHTAWVNGRALNEREQKMLSERKDSRDPSPSVPSSSSL